jgi:hypothetical protein
MVNCTGFQEQKRLSNSRKRELNTILGRDSSRILIRTTIIQLYNCGKKRCRYWKATIENGSNSSLEILTRDSSMPWKSKPTWIVDSARPSLLH